MGLISTKEFVNGVSSVVMEALSGISSARTDALDGVSSAIEVLDGVSSAMEVLEGATSAMDALDGVSSVVKALARSWARGWFVDASEELLHGVEQLETGFILMVIKL